ncbi:hypothetical protein NUW54_g5194 [Trametes sanguinea]|uniref:Uncharacterized protein n=1 Tax=Trametes sanguinea TaxID=158606 RepID=A0ACC1PZ93_9APHY|nr:hypothetical protein NUW54_g5194 [Trametes sanguinea]
MSVVSVNIATTNIEGALFGIFFALSVSAMCLLVNRRWKEVSASATTAVSWTVAFAGMWRSTLFIASILFILVISTHWCLGVRRMFDAFMYYDSGSSPGEYYSDLRQPYEVARTALLVFTLLIGDLVLVHRTWIVWNRNHWIALPPVVSSASLLASAIGVLHQFTVNKPTDSVFAKKITNWVIGVVVSTLLTKVYGTAMIATRIYLVNKSLRKTGLMTGGRSILEILMIFIESSTLSTAWTIFFAVAYATKSSLQSFPTGCSPAINGIAFMLITVRVGLGWDLQLGVTGSEDSPQTATLAPFQAYPLRTIRLTVTRTVEQETDFALSRHSQKRSEEGDGSVLEIGHGKT